MNFCAKCRKENADDVRFCVECGGQLDWGLSDFLSAHGLEGHALIFQSNDLLTVGDLLALDESDLRELGLPYGDLVRLRTALQAAAPRPSVTVPGEDDAGAAPPPAPFPSPAPAVAAGVGGSKWVVGALVGLGALALWFVFSGQKENASATSEAAASRDVIRVPQDHGTIASAMAAAYSGSTVLLAPGVYDRDSVIIRNVTNPAPVILAAGVSSSSVSDLAIDQQLFETGDNRFDAVELRDSSVDVRNCRVACRSSAGVWITGPGRNTVADCIVENCGRSGIYVLDSGGRSELQRNICRSNKGSGIDSREHLLCQLLGRHLRLA